MNHTFAEYSTGIAFSIQLSKNQCNGLLRVEEVNDRLAVTVTCLRALESRGLVFWHYKDGKANGFGGLTEAGKLMCALLRQAGLTVDNTNTVSVLRRLERDVA